MHSHAERGNDQMFRPLREQARSHIGCVNATDPVGASLLAKNDNAVLDQRSLRSISFGTYLPISNLPIAARCTSSGPSAKRNVRCIAYI